MKFVVDRNIRGAEETFGQHGELVVLDGRDIRRQHLADADALIIRTATRVDAGLLAGTPVGFVGTTSIGTDHLDLPWLYNEGISWANAPGCNADSAAQYTLGMIWLACERLGREPTDLSAGIIGRGNVGSRVQRLLETLGIETVANDPPLADRGEKGLVGLEEALGRDIVCLHVPLTDDGPYPTRQLIDTRSLAQIPDGGLLINAARGDVVEQKPLVEALASGRLDAALDVWPGEPHIDPVLLEACVVATPHVAGYSKDGKRRGTRMVYEAFCAWADAARVDDDPLVDEHRLTVPPGPLGIGRALEATCFVEQHDDQLRAMAGLDPEQRARGFDRLRRYYPARRDFAAWRISCPDPHTCDVLADLGFVIDKPE